MAVLGNLRLVEVCAVALVALTGCDVVFDLEREPPPELANYDRCGPFLYDEPLRYAAVANPKLALDPDGNPVLQPWSWDEARTACQLRGMDLAVFNDQHELGIGVEDAVWPYWIGQRMIGTSDETVDGCPAITAPVASRVVAADATACGVVAGPLEIDMASCDGKLPGTIEPGVVTSALCETPRPDRVECLGEDPLRAQYFLSEGPLSYDEAKRYCGDRDSHLAVVETQAEWLFLAAKTKSTWEKPFWIGSQLVGSTWQTVNGCHGMYSWTHNTPGTPASGSCVAAKVRPVDEADPELSGKVLDGVEPTACDDRSSYALCEID